MKNGWGNERGAALVLVMIALIIIGILFSGLIGVLNYTHKQALLHESQVRAEYNAQKMMEIALDTFYNDASHLSTVFASDPACLYDGSGESQSQVCYVVTKDSNDVITARSFVATGRDKANNKLPLQTSVITNGLPLPDPTPTPPDNGGDTGEGGNNGGGEDNGGGATTNPSPYTNGTVCTSGSTAAPVPLRALTLDGTFDVSLGIDDQSKTRYTSYPNGVSVNGGLYLHSGPLILPKFQNGNNEKNHITYQLSGAISYQQGDLIYDHGDGNGDRPDIPTGATADYCHATSTYAAFLQKLVAHYNHEGLFDLPVYFYDSKNITSHIVRESATNALVKAKGSSQYLAQSISLQSVLENTDEEKIVIVLGDLYFKPSLVPTATEKTRGFLIVYDPYQNTNGADKSNLYLTDNFAWDHQGAIATEQFGYWNGTAYENNAWPTDYLLSLSMSDTQKSLYLK